MRKKPFTVVVNLSRRELRALLGMSIVAGLSRHAPPKWSAASFRAIAKLRDALALKKAVEGK